MANQLLRPIIPLLSLALLLQLPLPARAATDAMAATAAGNWMTESDGGSVGIIQVSVDAQGRMEGRIVGGNHPGLRDERNPDPARRAQELRGQVIMRGLAYDGDGRWSGGTIYRASNGSTYKCKVELDGEGVLRVRGYIGFALLGVTQKWTRYTGASMDLPRAAQ
jgi:uncharacterized protein (DUF2147 family)